MNDEELRLFIEKGNKKLKQNIKKHKEDLRHDYDFLMIEKFKKENPEKVEQIRNDLIKSKPHLKYNKENLERKINKIILPPILEKADGHFYSVMTKKNGVMKNETLGGYHLPYLSNDESVQQSDDWSKSMMRASEDAEKIKGATIVIEIVQDLIDDLSDEETEIIKTLYNLPPYDESNVEDLKKKYNLNDKQLKEAQRAIILKLRKLL